MTSALVCTSCTRGVQEYGAICLVVLQSAEILGIIGQHGHIILPSGKYHSDSHATYYKQSTHSAKEQASELNCRARLTFVSNDKPNRPWGAPSKLTYIVQQLKDVPSSLRDDHNSLTISDQDCIYTKTLGIEWHSILDHFRLTVSHLTFHSALTKRALVSDVARTYDVLGWFSPAVIKAKILLQRVWEAKVDWDEEVPDSIREEWSLWQSQLKHLACVHIPRCYFPKDLTVSHLQLHGFSDASEDAYAAVVYIRATGSDGRSYVSLVTSKTKVSPIKRLTIPRLELCGVSFG